MLGAALRYPKSLWSHNPMPGQCELYLPLWSRGLSGSIFQSADHSRHVATATGTIHVPSLYRTFDNIDDKLSIPHRTNLNAVGQCTIIAWIRPTNTWQAPNLHQILDKRSDAGGVAPTLLAVDSGKMTMFAGTSCALGTTTSFAAGTWFMMASMAVDGVVGGAGNKIWVDGVDDTASTDTAVFVTNTVPLIIGASFADPSYGNFLDADMGELWFYPTKGFTTTEMLYHFHKTRWRYGK